MNSPVKAKLKRQFAEKMLKLDPQQRQRLARLELMRRNLDPSKPPKG
jgi:hypothetical protein